MINTTSRSERKWALASDLWACWLWSSSRSVNFSTLLAWRHRLPWLGAVFGLTGNGWPVNVKLWSGLAIGQHVVCRYVLVCCYVAAAGAFRRAPPARVCSSPCRHRAATCQVRGEESGINLKSTEMHFASNRTLEAWSSSFFWVVRCRGAVSERDRSPLLPLWSLLWRRN
jgi:hypothetical protein